MTNDKNKDAEIIDDLDLLGPIEESGVTSQSGSGMMGDRTDVMDVRGQRTGTQDMSAERTTIIDAFALTGRRPILSITAGPDAGKEVTVDSEVFEIGRGTMNSYVLHDLAVSRKHVKLVSQGETYMLVDSGSGNGSRVNGVRVQDIVLHDGDEISIGNTVMRFEWPLETSVVGSGEKTQIFAPISQIKKVQTSAKGVDMQSVMPWLLYGGGGLIIMAVIIVVVMAVVNKFGAEGDEGGGIDVLVKRNITAGIADFNAGQFSDSQKKFVVALTLEPANALANEYKAKSEKEIENEKAYQQAQKDIAERKFEEAAKQIRKIPAGSYFMSKLPTLKDRLMGVAASKLEEADELTARGQLTRAKRYIETVLVIDPDNKKAKELKKKIEEKQKSTVASETKKPFKRRRATSPRKKKRRRRPAASDPWEKSSSSSGGGLSKYTRAYKNGNASRAIDMLSASSESNSSKGKALLKKMRSFQIMYSQGKNLHQRGASAQAKKFLEKARKLDRQITRGSKYSKEIKKMLRSL